MNKFLGQNVRNVSSSGDNYRQASRSAQAELSSPDRSCLQSAVSGFLWKSPGSCSMFPKN